MSCFSFLRRRNDQPLELDFARGEEGVKGSMRNESAKMTAPPSRQSAAGQSKTAHQRETGIEDARNRSAAAESESEEEEQTWGQEAEWGAADQGPAEEAAPMRRKEIDTFRIRRRPKPAQQYPWPIRLDHKGDEEEEGETTRRGGAVETHIEVAAAADVGPGDTWEGAGNMSRDHRAVAEAKYGKKGERLMNDMLPDEDFGEADRLNPLKQTLPTAKRK